MAAKKTKSNKILRSTKVLVSDLCDALNSLDSDFYLEDQETNFWDEEAGFVRYDTQENRYTPIDAKKRIKAGDADFYPAWQGKGDEPIDRKGVPMSFLKFFEDFMAQKTHERLLFVVPHDKAQELKEFALKLGATLE